jgi:hypothetical protein
MHEAAVMAAVLTRRIAQGDARVGISDPGYVGLPLAVEFARLGFAVTGFDPANPTFAVKDIPKVVGGLTPECASLAALALPADRRPGRHRVESARGPAGEALRERLPQREHRARQRARSDVPGVPREDGAPSSRPVAGRSHA